MLKHMLKNLGCPNCFSSIRVLCSAILILHSPSVSWGQDNSKSDLVNAEAIVRLKTDIETLASDAMEGRGVGTQGLDVAADLIANRWKELVLNTDIFEGSPFQEFSLDGPIVLGNREQNRITLQGPSDQQFQLDLEKDFTPVSLGSSGTFDAPIVFAGYGITAQDEGLNLDYDDYAGLDVAGKVVIVLRKEPRQNDEKSPFSGTDPSQHAFFSAKLANAIQHKAAAMIIVNDRATGESSDGDVLPKVEGAGRSFTQQQIPTLWVKREIVDKMLATSLSKSLADLENEIESDLIPRSAEIPNWRAIGEANIQPSKIKLKNVVATLPGEGELAKEFIVIGAHYDHVGMGGQGSLAPETIAVHNGADDNASGTVSLLEVARTLKNTLSGNRRTIVFIAFSAEERGLIGSRYYVRNPRFALENTVAMLNLDMVGRFTGDVLTVFGTGTGKEFESLLEKEASTEAIKLEKIPFGYGPSDHQSFFEMKIPVLHFFTGLHNDTIVRPTIPIKSTSRAWR